MFAQTETPLTGWQIQAAPRAVSGVACRGADLAPETNLYRRPFHSKPGRVHRPSAANGVKLFLSFKFYCRSTGLDLAGDFVNIFANIIIPESVKSHFLQRIPVFFSLDKILGTL